MIDFIDFEKQNKNPGLYFYFSNVFRDDRGYFFESYNKNEIEKIIGNVNFVQDNESKSSNSVIRGLHYQCGEHAQSKLVRVIQGDILDFALDIRKSSPTFGKLFYIHLSGANKIQFFIPKGFAHGFVTLSKEDVIFSYKCDNYWNKQSERGINIFDKSFNIINNIENCLLNLKDDNLIFNKNQLIISQKDINNPNLNNATDLFK